MKLIQRMVSLFAVLLLLVTMAVAAEDTASNTLTLTYAAPPGSEALEAPLEGVMWGGREYRYVEAVGWPTTLQETKDVAQEITVACTGNSLEDVQAVLEPTIMHSEDGYTGVLTLDFASIAVEDGEQQTAYYTMRESREYPHLTSNDPSLVPKSITKNGTAYALEGIEWVTQASAAIDYQQVPTTYTAVATYTSSGRRTITEDYAVTATYTGTVAKTVEGPTTYDLLFALEQGDAEASGGTTAPGQSGATAPGQGSTTARGENSNTWKVVLALGVVALLIGGGVFVWRRRQGTAE